MLKLNCVTKRYGKFTAVDCLDLEIQKGQIFGFLGPNGAGKTTTIKMMCGLLAITEGDITVDGISVKNSPEEYKKKTAFIPDKPYMFEKLRGIEYVEFIASLYKVEKQKYRKLLDRYSHTFGVNTYINDFIESYSHGMSQKLLIVASLIHSPEIFILDEPMVGLDPRSMETLKTEFKKLAKQGMTIFMSTHSLDTAEQVCSHVGIIDKGRLLASGETKKAVKKGRSKKLSELFFKLTEETDEPA